MRFQYAGKPLILHITMCEIRQLLRVFPAILTRKNPIYWFSVVVLIEHS